jgi:hypothetical protein
MTATVASLAFNWRNLRQLKIGEPNPLGDMLIALKRRQFGAVQVLDGVQERISGIINYAKAGVARAFAG